MRLRPVVWPVAALYLSAALGFSLFGLGEDESATMVAFNVFFGICWFILVLAATLRRTDLRLRPDGLQRALNRRPSLVPWDSLQVVAIAGDAEGACPTLWTDDGREIYLDELGTSLGFGFGAGKMRRNCEHILALWEMHRGPAWQQAPWASGAVPGWVMGATGIPDASTPAAVTSRLRPAWYLPASATAVALGIFGWLSFVPWLSLSTMALNAVFLGGVVISARATWGARLSAYGIARWRGPRTRVAWPRVQAITVTGGRWLPS